MLKRRKSVHAASVIAAAVVILAFAHSASAEDPVNTGYFGDVAIKGYDPVAYFTDDKAIEGSPAYSHRWLGAEWHFASARNRDLFIANPGKYAPQYGGYCADGVSFGTVTTNIDPQAWRIIDGKLYLSYDPGAADGFEKKPSKVVDSKKHWSEVQSTLISDKLQKDWQHLAAD